MLQLTRYIFIGGYITGIFNGKLCSFQTLVVHGNDKTNIILNQVVYGIFHLRIINEL